jgi:hypothetical protein
MRLSTRILWLLVYPILEIAGTVYPALGQTDNPVIGAGHRG